ncbi:MAG: amidohydrolase family protein, partial [Cyclobacteriaceae bacterium]|nr:amidohydrolase family protein [Cyclobacteriaceae bacterium]
ALNTYVYPAESLIQELEIFQEAGLTPLQVLQTATRNGPSYFDADKKIGIIKSGALADLVLLDENPLVDVKGLRKINAVVKRGSFYSREKLDQLLKTAREAKVRLDAQRK